MSVLLINPPSRNYVYQNLAGELAAKEIPVWCGLIDNYLSLHGIDSHVLDGECEELSYLECAKQAVALRPKLVVFVAYGQQPSASTQCMPAASAVAKQIKILNESIPILVMGTHPSALPEKTLREEPFDFVCQGEGPITIATLYSELIGSCRLEKVPGLWYREKNEIHSNAPASLLQNLDLELPGINWKKFNVEKYRAHNWHCFADIQNRSPYASLQTSLGCPYHCSFCCINTPFGKSGLRLWSSAFVLNQIDQLVAMGVKNIKIPDELFVVNEKHVTEICQGIMERQYDLNIWAYARVDSVKEKYLPLLKKAGFHWLALGIESGSKHVRDGVEKGRFGQQEIIDVVEKIKNSGIYICGNYIFGLPDDTEQTMQETLDLAKFLNTEWANFYSAMAYPGSQLYKMALEKKWKLPEDWSGYSQHSMDCLPLPTETLTGEQVLSFRDKAFDEYFTSDNYLDLVERKFGARARAHIVEMTKTKIKRAHHLRPR